MPLYKCFQFRCVILDWRLLLSYDYFVHRYKLYVQSTHTHTHLFGSALTLKPFGGYILCDIYCVYPNPYIRLPIWPYSHTTYRMRFENNYSLYNNIYTFREKFCCFTSFTGDVCLFAITISTINLSINFNLSRVQKKIETIYIIML